MGIVFEPMYDPNQPSVQRGVRICDLPRTGAAALSRKLHIGDELLQINETTVSRMTFDEIMDFIIEADPESVNLLFRRPKKEALQARQGVQQKLNAAVNKDTTSTVKWDEAVDTEKSKVKKGAKYSRKKRAKKGSVSEEEETLQSSVADSYEKRGRRKKNKSRRGGPYESESFLDLLIDTICSNTNGICRDIYRKDDDFSYEDDSMSEFDEETYATYEESIERRPEKSSKKKSKYDDETDMESRRNRRKDAKNKGKGSSKKYEDDGTLETVESSDRLKDERRTAPTSQPHGLAPDPVLQMHSPPILPVIVGERDDELNRAPIRELEYEDDNGADVSVMESLGGPSLLIEKQRTAALQSPQQSQTVPKEIIDNYGLDYLPAYGMTRAQTIHNDPIKFYSHVVKQLLEKNEPEKVRLLDKLMAKYKGREDHLVQKLSVRYDKASGGEVAQSDKQDPSRDEVDFSDAVKKSKESYNAAAAVNMARGRMHAVSPIGGGMRDDWPEKEHKEEEYDDVPEEDNSVSGSEYSGDSVDGTSPAVIAQVSELLNYVYGKTSVPGQIDRVSTIMRAYEGREGVLLELLETKALIKANKEKESEDDLPSFLRNSNSSQASRNAEDLSGGSLPPVTPMAATQGQGTLINDDISSMSGVSNPAPEPYNNKYGMVSCAFLLIVPSSDLFLTYLHFFLE
jgi:hypothetical protein